MQENQVYEFNPSPPSSPKVSVDTKKASKNFNFPKFSTLVNFFTFMQKSRRPNQYKPLLT